MLTSQTWADGKPEDLNIKPVRDGRNRENLLSEVKDVLCRLPLSHFSKLSYFLEQIGRAHV